MKKWAVSAIVYLLLVVGGYTLYSQVFQPDNEASNEHNENHEKDTTSEEHGDHGEASTETASDEVHGEGLHESEVNVDIKSEGDTITISLKDNDGRPVNELEINHEKLLHLIIVGSDMETYRHLHPQRISEGMFEADHDLTEGSYKAFVDFKPINKKYHVEPIPFKVGQQNGEHHQPKLTESDDFTINNSGHQVTLTPSSFKAGKEVQLNFDLNGEVSEQYLGALGHVVIVDSNAQEYLHVHPLEGKEPVFATTFEEPGLYKLWAEFKFDGEVFVFPYVIRVQ
ncbi:hypothetical protein V1502_09255 [Bacillus sp. SCS-153A]|uniref:hypothetical protein n=1 Tax=Rossellomorea sedimentorum TaxID=3115294 RepID=UPI0039063BA9